MKKDIYFLLVTLLVAMLSLGVSSCSKDDEDGGSAIDGKVVGTWHRVALEEWSYEAGVLVYHAKETATSTREYEVVNGKETGKYWDRSYGGDLVEYTFGAEGSFCTKFVDSDERSGTYTASNGNMKVTIGNYSTNSQYSFRGDQLIITAEESGKHYEGRLVLVNYLEKGPYPGK